MGCLFAFKRTISYRHTGTYALSQPDASHLMDTYKRLPVTFHHGEGSWLYDTDGKRYLDALCGISVTSLGHNHSMVTAAIKQQAESLLHTSNLYRIDAQQRAADKLCALADMERVFFANSGAEANEAAIKLARRYGHQRNIAVPTIVTCEGSFHGRTMATLTATGNAAIKDGFTPLLDGFITVPYNDLTALQGLADNHNIVAVLLEPVQGEGGLTVADDNYLRGLADLCKKQQWLMMFDEVQTGNGRCGNYFAYQRLGLSPDVVTTAKGLGNGVPIGACLARGNAATIFSPGNHGSTFGGNPLACAAALAVMETIEREALGARALTLGDRLRAQFTEQLSGLDAIVEIRGVGLMIGIELAMPCVELVTAALDDGLLINVTAGNVVRLLPPLNISDQDADTLVDKTVALIRHFVHNHTL